MDNQSCEICGNVRHLDRHHVVSRGMGGSKDSSINDEDNLITLCRSCHRNIHEERWEFKRSAEDIRVFDTATGEQVMRRFRNPGLDVPSMFQILNLAEESVTCLLKALPYLTDEELVEAFGYAGSFGKRAWLLQAAILYEAQKRSTYGEHTLEAIARRFEIGIRQAEKYALVWKVFFVQGDGEHVNIDAILLDEPSWYVVAATETREPEKWLSYAQDRKMQDPRYSVAALRRDIRITRLIQGMGDVKDMRETAEDLSPMDSWACPWIKLLCVHSSQPIPFRDCKDCEFSKKDHSDPDLNVD